MKHLEKKLDRLNQQLEKSEGALNTISLFEALHSLFEKSFINEEEFSYGKEYLLSGMEDTHNYKEEFLDAIPVLNEARAKGMLNRDEYHRAILLTLGKKREIYDAKELCSGAITFKNYLHDHNLLHRHREYGVNDISALAGLLGQDGYKASNINLTWFGHKVEFRKEDTFVTLSQFYVFGPSKIRVDDGKQSHRYTLSDAVCKLKLIVKK